MSPKIFSTKKWFIALFGVVLFFSLVPFAFAKAETCKERLENATEEGVYLYYEDNGETKWWRTTETISDICGEKPASVEACPEDAELCTFWGGTKFVKIVGNYDVRLYLGKDCQSTHICFNGPLEESDLKDYGIGEGRINSLRILSKPCGEPGVFIKEDAPPEDYCGAGEGSWNSCGDKCGPWWNPLNTGCYIGCTAQYISSLPLRIPMLLLAIVIGVIAFVLGGLFSLTAGLLNWVIHTCLFVPIISAPVVKDVGWAFSRDFVNMLFILIIVIIGLATILRIESYGLKKTLPTLLLIALLVNFSLVLVGFIVDISNITTNFFLDKVADCYWGWQFVEDAQGYFSDAVNKILLSHAGDMGWLEYYSAVIYDAAAVIVQGIILCIFYIGAAIVYLMAAFLLFFRIIALWVLAILAPFAFFCYILPATRKGWDIWWKNLLQWSIIGIPLGFFLYLATYLHLNKTYLESAFNPSSISMPAGATTEIASTASSSVDLITNMISPVVSLVFLAIGVLIALKMAPAGADFIMKGAKIAGGMALKSKLGRTAISKMAGGGAKFLGKSEAFAKWSEKQVGKVPLIGKPLSWAGKPFSWGTAATRYALAPKLTEISAEAKRTPMPKGFKDWDADDQERWIKANDLTGRDRIRDSFAMGENLEFISKEFKETLKADHGKYGEELGLQKYIKNFYKFFPEEQSEKVMTNMKMATKVDKKAKEEAKGNMEREITLMTNEIQKDENTKEEILNISAALKFNIDKKKVDQNLRNQITPEEFKKTARDVSAGAIFSKGLEPGDIKKVANPDSLQLRLGTRYMSPNHFRKMMDEWDKETFDKVLNGPGGLRSTVKTQEDLVELFADNPQLGEWGIKSPVGRSIFREWDKLMPKEKEEEGKKKVLTADEQFAELKELAAKRRDEKREEKEKYEESLKGFVEGAKRVEEATRKRKIRGMRGVIKEKIKGKGKSKVRGTKFWQKK